MRRGGDTPGTQTLFALEIENGRFISFYFQDGVLYANTDDGSSALWVLDGNGVVIDNISYSIADRAPILAQINEHYGTSFKGWSDNEISLSLGETIPNWAAYEKIELERQKISIEVAPDVWIIGDFLDGIYRTWTNPGAQASISVHADGIVYGNQGVPAAAGVAWFNQYLSKIGLEATSVEDYYISMPIGTAVPGWNEYEKVPY